MAADNKTLARFILDGIPPAPRGVPQIEVTFDIDANGILNVTAKDKASGKSQSVRIEASTALSKEEIERLKNEAAAHASEDAAKKELVEAKNQAESLIYVSEKSLRDAGDKVPADIKSSITSKIEELKKAKDSDNLEEIKSKTADLSNEIQKIGQSMYNQNNDQQSGPNQSTETK
jgi:molecular chaperone DnaK